MSSADIAELTSFTAVTYLDREVSISKRSSNEHVIHGRTATEIPRIDDDPTSPTSVSSGLSSSATNVVGPDFVRLCDRLVTVLSDIRARWFESYFNIFRFRSRLIFSHATLQD